MVSDSCQLSVMPMVTVAFLFAIIGFKIRHITPEEKVQEMPEEASFRGVGGHRVGPTEHEAEVWAE